MKTFAIANLESAPDEAFFERVARLGDAGVDFVLLRDGRRPDGHRYRTARRLRSILPPPVRFLVHGRADLALASGATGIHLPSTGVPVPAVRKLVPKAVVGRACHSVEDCRRAEEEGADYVLLGPVFAPRSKPGEAGIHREELARAARLKLDVFAVGGLSTANLASLGGLGLAGVAAITMFMKDEPIEAVVEAVRRS